MHHYNKYFMNVQLQFCTLKIEESPQIFTIIMEANRNTFPLLVHNYQPLEEFQQETRGVIEVCFKSQERYQKVLGAPFEYNYGIRANGKLVAVMLSLDLIQEYEYLKPHISNPAHVGHQFSSQFAGLGIETMMPGTASYFTRLSVLPEVMGKGIGKRLVYEACRYQRARGYQYAIVGSIVEASYHMFTRMGGEVVRHVEAVRPTFTYQINIIKSQFRRLMEIYQDTAQKSQ